MDPLRHGSDLKGVPNGGANWNSVVNSAELRTKCSISYADSKLSAFVELNSPAEYRTWLLNKVKYMTRQGSHMMFPINIYIYMELFLLLVDMVIVIIICYFCRSCCNRLVLFTNAGMEDRLRNLCEDLLGPVHHSSSRGKNWQSTILVTCTIQTDHLFTK